LHRFPTDVVSVTIDTALVPPYLRCHILPTVRPVFFDDPAPSPESVPADSDHASTSAAANSLAKPSEVSVETQFFVPTVRCGVGT
jgi:hypothetical protein